MRASAGRGGGGWTFVLSGAEIPATVCTLGALYYEAQNDYTHTHTFLLFGNSFANYTGHLLHKAFWQELFCVIRRHHKVLSVNAPITHINCLGIDFPITRTSVTQKNCFRIICVIISGSHTLVPAHQAIQKTAPIPKSPPNDPEGAKAPQNEGVKVRGVLGGQNWGAFAPSLWNRRKWCKNSVCNPKRCQKWCKNWCKLHHIFAPFLCKSPSFCTTICTTSGAKRVVLAPSVCTIVLPKKRYTCIYNTIKPINSIAPLISNLALCAEKHHFCCPLWGKTRAFQNLIYKCVYICIYLGTNIHMMQTPCFLEPTMWCKNPGFFHQQCDAKTLWLCTKYLHLSGAKTLVLAPLFCTNLVQKP